MNGVHEYDNRSNWQWAQVGTRARGDSERATLLSTSILVSRLFTKLNVIRELGYAKIRRSSYALETQSAHCRLYSR